MNRGRKVSLRVMEFSVALELGRDAFWMALMTSAPILVIGLVVGLAISLFQAVTSCRNRR